jgi:hypothetical protein
MGKIIFTKDEINDMIEKYSKNLMSTLDIGKIYKRDSSTIKRVLTENGVTVYNGSAFSLNYWIKRGLTEDEANHKLKTMKPCLIEYWEHRGYFGDDAKLQTELHLMNTERAFIVKYGEDEGKKRYTETRTKTGKLNSVRRVEYWIKKGFTEEDSKKKVSETQSTFSYSKCVEKFGEKLGGEVFSNRQKKWQETLQNKVNYDEEQKKKDSRSYAMICEKYPENVVDVYYEKNIVNNNLECLREPTKQGNYQEFLKTILNNFDYDSDLLRSISKIKLYQQTFVKTQDVLYFDLKKIYGARNGKKQSYGTIFYIDGYTFKSLGEKKIYDYLKLLNINFIYDKFYPNEKRFRYDFYLPDYNVYIEYFGMLKVKETTKNEKTIRNYKLKCEQKMKLCLEKKYKFIFSSNYEIVMEEITKLLKNE